jgi:hypothetical protein
MSIAQILNIYFTENLDEFPQQNYFLFCAGKEYFLKNRRFKPIDIVFLFNLGVPADFKVGFLPCL